MLFIFFAEDRGLLTPYFTLQILEKWKADIDFGDERPLYDLFKQYFKYLDTGRKGTPGRVEIHAYNGGLFQPDALLDRLEIDDEPLFHHTRKLASRITTSRDAYLFYEASWSSYFNWLIDKVDALAKTFANHM